MCVTLYTVAYVQKHSKINDRDVCLTAFVKENVLMTSLVWPEEKLETVTVGPHISRRH